VSVETTAYYIPSLRAKLFSLQAYFHEWDDVSDFILNCDQAMLCLTGPKEGEVHSISIHYNHQMQLPTM